MIQYSYIGWVGPVPRATVAKTPFPRESPMVSVFYLVSVNPMASNGIRWYQSLNHFQRHDGPGLLRLKLDLSDSLIRMCFAFKSCNFGQQLATKYWSHWHTRTHREEPRLFEGFDPPDRHRHKTHHNEVLSQHHRCEQRSRSPQSIGRCACPPWQPSQSRFATECQSNWRKYQPLSKLNLPKHFQIHEPPLGCRIRTQPWRLVGCSRWSSVNKQRKTILKTILVCKQKTTNKHF